MLQPVARYVPFSRTGFRIPVLFSCADAILSGEPFRCGAQITPASTVVSLKAKVGAVIQSMTIRESAPR